MVKRTSGWLRPIGRGEHRRHGERGRDRGDPEVSDQPALERIDVLAHGAGIADDAPRPFEHPFAFRREAPKPRTALHQQHAEHVFKIFDASRQGRLAYAADFGGAAEMLLARQRDDEFKFLQHESEAHDYSQAKLA